ncbi:MAG: L-serine ammonia-lyase, iron-sulfur-dependent subunit beta [Bacteroidia bacterium]|nr:L-serine ammonia-lyase, iron-sulfur-dependent subunit beta [Bacteroidia bacterium]MCX7652212.1 L-serine ammonia-lyase, iron-sulfur-dependent subunit beta [Bacteroidia bacterium]MDW8416474.1 L-serine ammonia-lyase, iron-sulfur-dependent subunit beta [Bacteroidia bacterium]
MSQEPSGIFDMLGPIMIGPSSSHTAGVVRIARVAHFLLGGAPERADITFYNSFAMTYKGHGSDRAALAGLMGFAVDDERIRDALALADEAGLAYTFDPVISSAKSHPNTLFIRAQRGERRVEVEGISRGGGLILISGIDGLHTNFTGQLYTLVVRARDVRGAVAFLSAILAYDNVNIATLTVSRRAKDDLALQVYELDEPLRSESLSYIQTLPWIVGAQVVPPV